MVHRQRPEILLPTLLSLQHEGAPGPRPRGDGASELVYHQGTTMTSSVLTHTEPGSFARGDMSWFTYDAAQDATGAFMSVFKHRSTNDLTVMGDFHGFQKIFWFDAGGGRVLLSDSLMALVAHVRALGFSIRIDAPTVAGQYGAFNALLTHHSFSSRTIVDGIDVLRADEILAVTRVGVAKRRRARFVDPHERPYEELIADALGRGAASVSASLSWDVTDRVLYLSGGRDSRSVLALALASGSEREFAAFAKPPPADGSKFSQKLSIDRAIAGQLVAEFRLPLWADEHAVRVASRGSERAWWLSHWAGISHDFESPAVGSLTPALFLTGAMGENYRTKVPDFLTTLPGAAFEMTEESFDRDFETFFERLLPRYRGLDGEAWQALRSEFLTSLTYDGVSNALWERVDAFSEVFRMSAHFGRASAERSVNRWNLNVLALPELTYAASRLPRHERAGGRIWRDLHDLADRRLNAIPYEFEFIAADGSYHGTPASEPRVDWASMDARHATNARRNAGARVPHAAGSDAQTDRTACLHLLAKLRDVIAPTVGVAKVDYLSRRADEGSILLKRLRGKLELLDELCDPQITWSAVHVTIS